MNLLNNAQLNVSKVVDSLIYLDACAAAPPHPLVLAAMAEHQADTGRIHLAFTVLALWQQIF